MSDTPLSRTPQSVNAIGELVGMYKYLHANPELSLQEHRTSDYVARKLAAYGYTVHRIGGTGVVGVLVNGEGPTIAYRADMDGLPVKEQTSLEYASTATAILNGAEVPVMHACGHDVHMAVALGTAELLSDARARWGGTAVFIFQPAEEIAAGAKAMVDDGLWCKIPKPEIVLGQHVMPYEAGKLFFPIGPAMSMADSWKVTLHGKGAHGSQPDESIDPIVLGASIVMRLQTIVSREVNPREIAVVTVGTFHSGLKENIIPESAELTVNVRTFTFEVREKVLKAIRRIVSAEAAAAGAPDPDIEVISEFPPCYNDPEETRRTMAAIAGELGSEKVVESLPHMASEDFGHLGQSIGIPTVYWFLGSVAANATSDPGAIPVNHSPHFAPVPDPTLTTGLAAAATAILARLGKRA
ncbi:amidohydrolase [Micrococcaceae bacterium Sec7.4]